ncbi:hypothetical protein ELG88_08360 [Rhizobium leguminosarum]|uniref:hypothetical protein n=1 Tax=Rhizobium leguminosarum TaxID=384 RepID=UPI0010317A7F|nr:hypothetical protein [Rhizobium leguminosarum]TBF35226.1 hypothetical protein ELG88_08360 [Rhizobium leguminosarum]
MRRDEITDDLMDLGFDFLFFYARFEFALKENKYLKKSKPGAPAEAGWTAFTAKWQADYKLTAAAAALIEAAPKREVIGDDGSPHFKAIEFPAATSDLEKVVVYCRTVRNNLFHGGKSGAGGWGDPVRTKMLLATVNEVLGELAQSGDIEPSYTGRY